jgi:hypothetical protein
MEHLEEKDVESVVAIPMFLCGSPHPCQLRTAPFWPRWQALRERADKWDQIVACNRHEGLAGAAD